MARQRETLQDIIDAAGMPVGEVAKIASLTPRALLRLRKGLVAVPRSATVGKLAKALGVPPARVRAAIEASRR